MRMRRKREMVARMTVESSHRWIMLELYPPWLSLEPILPPSTKNHHIITHRYPDLGKLYSPQISHSIKPKSIPAEDITFPSALSTKATTPNLGEMLVPSPPRPIASRISSSTYIVVIHNISRTSNPLIIPIGISLWIWKGRARERLRQRKGERTKFNCYCNNLLFQRFWGGGRGGGDIMGIFVHINLLNMFTFHWIY